MKMKIILMRLFQALGDRYICVSTPPTPSVCGGGSSRDDGVVLSI